MIERRHRCHACGKLFKNPSDFKTHYMCHTGEKPYACGVCGRKFAHQANLKNHKITHVDTMPHCCPHTLLETQQ
ncbi:hypothetical protein HPB52_004206 [Rhipicephalus sanguineus]|uniref:C2H2-type domain-containing protein n=1 Tax=Rhipicephalus sanguineus TaxID=34632 RepID=A0A9D4PC32_RHISA|nr:hypothetical protein HPB52_004206 [Rhipicephalus sanguineus]